MMRKLFILPALLVAMLLVFGCQQSSTTTSPTITSPTTTSPTTTSPTTTSPKTIVVGNEVGNLAPDFQLQDLKGNTVILSSLKGSPVILNFWAVWCVWCRYEMPFIQEIYEDEAWQDQGLVILAINIEETASTVRQYMQSNNLSFPVLLDTNGDVAQKYNVHVPRIPVTVLVDKDGIIQEWHLGAFSSKADIENSLKKIIP